MTSEVVARRGGVTVRGFGSGKSGSASGGVSEEADSLASISYARLLMLLSEGEIYGPTNQANPLRSVYLNSTPLENADGSLNFERVTIDFRAGTQDQEIVSGFPVSEAEVSVGVELTSTVAWTQAFTDLDLSACRVTLAVSGLSKTNAKSGKISGYEIAYAIDLQTDYGGWKTVISTSFSGKATSTYQRSHRIDFPAATSGWLVRVRRLTANANSSLIADRTQIVSYARIVDAKLRYPMSALLGLRIDAKQFSSVPTVAVDAKGKLIRVPANYDPDSRAYSGAWDGSFKVAWSDNPAWVLYDLCASDRYGLADRIGAARLSTLKWSLYQIGQYCDELVPDGLGDGGMEPRFTCNAYIQSQSDAWKLVSDIASIFRGMAYEAAGGLLASADMPADPVYTYSNANVVDGKFTRVGTARSTRHSVALVGWRDLSDMGRAKVEVVENQDALSRYGLRQLEIDAFGCTSRGQAIRAGRWALLTSWACTQTVTFDVGLDHALVQPGSIVRVVDQHLAGRRVGGRIRAATATTVTVDTEVVARDGDRLVVNLPDGTAESRLIGSVGYVFTADQVDVSADVLDQTADAVGLATKLTVITVTAPYSAVPQAEAIWTVESEELTSQLYRIHSVARSGKHTATITGLQHEPSVLTAVDDETKIDTRTITVIPAYQGAPTGVTVTEWTVISQGISAANVTIAWTPQSGAIEHEVQWRRDDSSWVSAGRTGAAEIDLTNVYAGTYVARVRSYNAADVASPWAYSASTEVTGAVGDPPVVASLSTSAIVFGITVKWIFPTAANILERTELWYGASSDRAKATKLSDLSYPTNSFTLNGLAAGVTLYFWVRLVDKNGEAGTYYPAGAGIAGTSSSGAGEILGYLTGKITSTQLYADLAAKIDTGAQAAVSVDTVVDDLAALYTIKTQVTRSGRRYLAGIGVGVENNNGVLESQVLVAADRFAVLNGEGKNDVAAPFVIQNGQTFINQAFIGDAQITSAMIADLDGAKIKAGTIDARQINAESITTDKIVLGGVTTDRLALQSVNAISVYTASAGLDRDPAILAELSFTNTEQQVRIDVSFNASAPLYTSTSILLAVDRVVVAGQGVAGGGPTIIWVGTVSPGRHQVLVRGSAQSGAERGEGLPVAGVINVVVTEIRR